MSSGFSDEYGLEDNMHELMRENRSLRDKINDLQDDLRNAKVNDG